MSTAGAGAPREVVVVGIGDAGRSSLSEEALGVVRGADVLAGGERHLAFFPEFHGERIVLKDKMAEAAGAIDAARRRGSVAVLASGDPLFYGIGAYLARKLGRDAVRILPNVSAMQLAFARARVAWQDAALVSLHGRPMENLTAVLGTRDAIGVFTDGTNTPGAIARACLDSGARDYRMVVCENLGGSDEKVREMALAEAVQAEAGPLNVVILRREESGAPKEASPIDPASLGAVGIPDDRFVYRSPDKALITKLEVRLVSLAAMRLRPSDTVWDVGAGSGAVAIECARLAPRGKVFAIEKNRPDFDLIASNLSRFGVANVTAVCGRAPEEGLGLWPDPDAVFVGGSGGELDALLGTCLARLKPGGRLVLNAATLETLAGATAFFRKAGLRPAVTLVQASRGVEIAAVGLTRFEALNPVYVLAARKGGA
ncbi:MAG: precorrin-6y C5,15-methyltransferase (decarboxylating) subunit CbiE [Planctomycetes bacterium]|nr:precorrin-6y C5,15-methyltransferase (decarboxylating) subunit CbiE [Planctomycetota bacterium]